MPDSAVAEKPNMNAMPARPVLLRNSLRGIGCVADIRESLLKVTDFWAIRAGLAGCDEWTNFLSSGDNRVNCRKEFFAYD